MKRLVLVLALMLANLASMASFLPTPAHAVAVDALVVAGGGGGGDNVGGGGGGGDVEFTAGLTVNGNQAYSVTIGVAGTAGALGDGAGGKGGNSSFASLTATGGGGGGGNSPNNGTSGGSGGGAGYNTTAGTAGTGSNVFGGGTPLVYAGGGGGGASAVGQNAPSTSVAGNGGNGYTSTISGVSTTYAGGGGGGIYGGTTPGNGGTGGGGAGGGPPFLTAAIAGGTNTGGGGGGGPAGGALPGAAGGSGIVIVRWSDAYDAGSATGSYSMAHAGGYYVYTFTGNGSITPPTGFTPTPTFTYSPTATRTATPSATPSFTNSPVASPTASPTATPTATPACVNVGTTSPAGYSQGGNGLLFFKSITFSGPTTLQTVSVYVVSGYGPMQAALYSDWNGNPFNLITLGSRIHVFPGWNVVPVGSPYEPAGNYWLGVETTNSAQVQYSIVGNDLFSYYPYGTWPNPATTQNYLGTVSAYGFICHY